MSKRLAHLNGINPLRWDEQTKCTGEDCIATVVRGDTGMCERCTAKTAAYRRSWQQWTDAVHLRAGRTGLRP